MSERMVTISAAAAMVQRRLHLPRCRRAHIEQAAERLGVEVQLEPRMVRVIPESAIDAIAAELRQNPPERRVRIKRRKRCNAARNGV